MSRDGEMLAAQFEAMQHGQADVISSGEDLIDENLMEELREDLRVSRENRKPVRPPEKRRRPGGFARFLIAICLGVAGTWAWQSYGEGAKQIIATTAPDLGWSPEAKQMIASSLQWLGWRKTSPGPETTAVQAVAPKAPTGPSVDSPQVQQMAQNLVALREMVQQLTAGQDQTTRKIAKLESTVMAILMKIPESAPQPLAASGRKPAPVVRPSPRVPTAEPSSRLQQ